MKDLRKVIFDVKFVDSKST